MPFCGGCGANLVATAVFCGGCGARTESAPVTAVVPPVSPTSMSTPSLTTPPTGATLTTPTAAPTPTTPTSSSSFSVATSPTSPTSPVAFHLPVHAPPPTPTGSEYKLWVTITDPQRAEKGHMVYCVDFVAHPASSPDVSALFAIYRDLNVWKSPRHPFDESLPVPPPMEQAWHEARTRWGWRLWRRFDTFRLLAGKIRDTKGKPFFKALPEFPSKGNPLSGILKKKEQALERVAILDKWINGVYAHPELQSDPACRGFGSEAVDHPDNVPCNMLLERSAAASAASGDKPLSSSEWLQARAEAVSLSLEAKIPTDATFDDELKGIVREMQLASVARQTDLEERRSKIGQHITDLEANLGVAQARATAQAPEGVRVHQEVPPAEHEWYQQWQTFRQDFGNTIGLADRESNSARNQMAEIMAQVRALSDSLANLRIQVNTELWWLLAWTGRHTLDPEAAFGPAVMPEDEEKKRVYIAKANIPTPNTPTLITAGTRLMQRLRKILQRYLDIRALRVEWDAAQQALGAEVDAIKGQVSALNAADDLARQYLAERHLEEQRRLDKEEVISKAGALLDRINEEDDRRREQAGETNATLSRAIPERKEVRELLQANFARCLAKLNERLKNQATRSERAAARYQAQTSTDAIIMFGQELEADVAERAADRAAVEAMQAVQLESRKIWQNQSDEWTQLNTENEQAMKVWQAALNCLHAGLRLSALLGVGDGIPEAKAFLQKYNRAIMPHQPILTITTTETVTTAEVTCPNCASPSAEHAAFCLACGTQLASPPAPLQGVGGLGILMVDSGASVATTAAPVSSSTGAGCPACSSTQPGGYCLQCGAKKEVPSSSDKAQWLPSMIGEVAPSPAGVTQQPDAVEAETQTPPPAQEAVVDQQEAVEAPPPPPPPPPPPDAPASPDEQASFDTPADAQPSFDAPADAQPSFDTPADAQASFDAPADAPASDAQTSSDDAVLADPGSPMSKSRSLAHSLSAVSPEFSRGSIEGSLETSQLHATEDVGAPETFMAETTFDTSRLEADHEPVPVPTLEPTEALPADIAPSNPEASIQIDASPATIHVEPTSVELVMETKLDTFSPLNAATSEGPGLTMSLALSSPSSSVEEEEEDDTPPTNTLITQACNALLNTADPVSEERIREVLVGLASPEWERDSWLVSRAITSVQTMRKQTALRADITALLETLRSTATDLGTVQDELKDWEGALSAANQGITDLIQAVDREQQQAEAERACVLQKRRNAQEHLDRTNVKLQAILPQISSRTAGFSARHTASESRSAVLDPLQAQMVARQASLAELSTAQATRMQDQVDRLTKTSDPNIVVLWADHSMLSQQRTTDVITVQDATKATEEQLPLFENALEEASRSRNLAEVALEEVNALRAVLSTADMIGSEVERYSPWELQDGKPIALSLQPVEENIVSDSGFLLVLQRQREGLLEQTRANLQKLEEEKLQLEDELANNASQTKFINEGLHLLQQEKEQLQQLRLELGREAETASQIQAMVDAKCLDLTNAFTFFQDRVSNVEVALQGGAARRDNQMHRAMAMSKIRPQPKTDQQQNSSNLTEVKGMQLANTTDKKSVENFNMIAAPAAKSLEDLPADIDAWAASIVIEGDAKEVTSAVQQTLQEKYQHRNDLKEKGRLVKTQLQNELPRVTQEQGALSIEAQKSQQLVETLEALLKPDPVVEPPPPPITPPVTTQPTQAAQPQVTQPQVTQPQVTQPQAPQVTPPQATQPPQAEQPQGEPQTTPGMGQSCSQCKATNQHGSFCNKCGFTIGDSSSACKFCGAGNQSGPVCTCCGKSKLGKATSALAIPKTNAPTGTPVKASPVSTGLSTSPNPQSSAMRSSLSQTGAPAVVPVVHAPAVAPVTQAAPAVTQAAPAVVPTAPAPTAAAPAAQAAPAGMTCPNCRTPGQSGFCQQCGTNLRQAPASAATWTCSCGTAGQTGAFCASCGSPKPVPRPAATLTCGNCNLGGQTGAFCMSCGSRLGAPKPPPTSDVCNKCGATGQTGAFCSLCSNPLTPQTKTCPQCNQPNQVGAFCLHCGCKLATVQPPKPEPKMCNGCGKPGGTGNFCLYCGKKL